MDININDSKINGNIENSEENKTFLGYYKKNIKLLLSVFNGRAGRKEYWSSIIFNVLIGILSFCVLFFAIIYFTEFSIFSAIIAGIVEFIMSMTGALFFITFVRRLHDLGISAKIYFSVMVSILIILSIFAEYSSIAKGILALSIVVFSLFSIIYVGCFRGKDEPNKYGMPKLNKEN